LYEFRRFFANRRHDGVTVTADSFLLRDVTVSGFDEDGVHIDGAKNFTLLHVNALSNGDNGIYLVNTFHGLIDSCTAAHTNGTGVYVGQSSHVTVRYCKTFDSVTGIEVENASSIRAAHNESRNNSAGILVRLPSGHAAATADQIDIDSNFVHDNNGPNHAPADSSLAAVPSGSGILVIGASHVMVEHNKVVRNHFVGIGVGSSLQLTAVSATAGNTAPAVGTVVTHNVVKHNGAKPPASAKGGDLVWDGTGIDNRWTDIRFQTSGYGPLPS
jgi:parallel beta-helix repeat protein